MSKKRGRRHSKDTLTSNLPPTFLPGTALFAIGMVLSNQIKSVQLSFQTILTFWLFIVFISAVLFIFLGLHRSFSRTRHIEYWKFREKSTLALYFFLVTTMVGGAFKYGRLLTLAFFLYLLCLGIRKVKRIFNDMRSILPSSFFNQRQEIEHVTLEDIDQMSGTEFEVFLHELFDRLGHYAELTPHTDYGIDLITIEGKVKTGIQAKCYGEGKTVGVAAVNEVCGGAGQWKVQRKMVITNRYFSKKAEISAKSNQVELVDRDELHKLIQEYNNSKSQRNIPRFLRLDDKNKDKSA